MLFLNQDFNRRGICAAAKKGMKKKAKNLTLDGKVYLEPRGNLKGHTGTGKDLTEPGCDDLILEFLRLLSCYLRGTLKN